MSEIDSYDIIVDASAWSGTRAGLADLVARVLGSTSLRVRPILDLPSSPVATYESLAEAEAVADALASRGVAVQVARRAGRRRSLGELTARGAGAGAPPRETQASSAPTDATMTPGWASRGGPKTPPVGAPGTMVGLPSWQEDLQSTVQPGGKARSEALSRGAAASGVPAEGAPVDDAPPPASRGADAAVAVPRAVASAAPEAAGASADESPTMATLETLAPASRGSDAASATPPPAPASASEIAPADPSADAPTVLRPPPPRASEADGWAGILGSALAERLVDGEDETAPMLERPPIPARRPAGDGRAGGPDTLVAPGSSDTLDPNADRDSLRAQIARVRAEVPPPRADEPSAWARAGVDIEGVREVAPAVVVPVRAPASLRASTPDSQDLARGDTLVFDPAGAPLVDAVASPAPLSPDLAGEGEEADPADLSIGDRFVRLRPPPARAADAVSPERAAFWGALAPGGGFAYLGTPARGVSYALGAVLVVPWLKGMVDAAREAAEIRDGKRLAARRGEPIQRLAYVSTFWLAAAVVVGVVWSAGVLLSASDPAESPASIPVPVVPVDTTSNSGLSEPPSGAEVPSPTPDAESADDLENARRLDELVRRARIACEGERYFECRQLAEEALSIDGRDREARLLHVRAVTQGVVDPPPDPQPESGHDRQPQRPPAPR